MKRKILIPTIEEIEKAIKDFSDEKWGKMDCDKVNEYVKSLDEFFVEKLGFIFKTVRISNTGQLTSKVYRIRKKEDGINTSLISEFSHPPINRTTIQRANLPGHPVFYCSPNAGTSLLESLVKTFDEKGDNQYYLSEWEFTPNLPAYVTIFLYGEYDKVDFFNSISDKNLNDFVENLDNPTEDEIRRLKMLFRQFSSLFETKNEHYLSSYLGHIHFYDKSNIRTDVMIYPSIELEKGSLNYAVHPNTVFHKMKLKRIFSFNVNSYVMDLDTMKAEISFQIEDSLGINNDHGYLIWRNLSEEDHKDFEKLFPAK
ncbi:MAG: RES family NAD+ phosphorylase [Chitinophagaceae bacterium]